MSYIKIYLHCVWSTKFRLPQISFEARPKLLEHIREQAQQKDIYIDFINAHLDHIHVLISLGKQQNIADVIQNIKRESAYWMNKNHIIGEKFKWQDDYYAAAVSYAHLPKVREYIKNQDEHHRTEDFSSELDRFCIKNGLFK